MLAEFIRFPRSEPTETAATAGTENMNATNLLTYPGIGLAVFGQQFCLPLPSMLLLMTAGALAAEGKGHLNLWLVLLAGATGCLAADGFWFWLGRRWGGGVIRLVCSLTSDPMLSRENSTRIFQRWGLRLLLVAKFIPGLDGVSPPLAGAGGASVIGFLLYDTAGSLLWTGSYLLLGFIFSAQLNFVLHLVESFGKVLLIVVGIPLFGYVLWRALHLLRIIRHLRLRRISPTLLQLKMEHPDKIAIIDLLHYEADERAVPGIPGAMRLDPGRLRAAPKITMPEGVDIVLYCSSRNEFVSARVAEAIKAHGVTNVWVLEGGLKAWAEEGRPVTLNFPSGAEVAERVGIVLPPEMLE
jgi:membrane protein DedA with SNARE-associated domain/rhodanese-related sulfurtransferase